MAAASFMSLIGDIGCPDNYCYIHDSHPRITSPQRDVLLFSSHNPEISMIAIGTFKLSVDSSFWRNVVGLRSIARVGFLLCERRWRKFLFNRFYYHYFFPLVGLNGLSFLINFPIGEEPYKCGTISAFSINIADKTPRIDIVNIQS